MKSKILLAVAVLPIALFAACRRPLAFAVLDTGVAAALADRWDDAVVHWKTALDQDPGSAAAHNNLAVALEKKGAWEDARKEYEAALALAPDNATIKDNFDRFKRRLEAARTDKSPAADAHDVSCPRPGRDR